jgi:non-heme chloroperoxidase
MTWSCSTRKTDNPIMHQIKFLNGSTNNKLEVLDWGGEGKTMILLSGMGNTGHVFDEFAPKFTDRFHVYAITRRGFGASLPSVRYDMKTLTDDILAVIDSLRKEKVILVGHSIAGDEITKFAVLHPSRVDKIVYLDAAYDRTTINQFIKYFPEFPKASTEDSSSFLNLKKFLTTRSGVSMPDEDIRQISIFSGEGKFVKDVTADSIIGALFASVEHPDYNHIKCPALAIYAFNDSITQAIPFYAKLDPINRQKADTLYHVFNKFSDEERARFKKEVQGGIVKEVRGANHYIFISHPGETEKLIREFLQ